MEKRVIELPDDLFARLQRHAVPLVDTPISVIERALVALEAGDESAVDAVRPGSPRTFNPAAPPNLRHTTPREITVGSAALKKGAIYWNALMFAVIAEAASRGIGKEDLLDLLMINCVGAQKEDQGYRYLPSVGISVQGQDANAAWRQTYRIASSIGIRVAVVFAWQDHDKAAFPNSLGSFFVEGA